MRIGISLNLLQSDAGGAGNYVLTLLRHWPQFAPEHTMVLFAFEHNKAMLDPLPPESRRDVIWLRVQEDVTQHLDKIDVYFCPFSSLWPRPLPIPSVLTFHDMQERFFPEFFSAAQLEERFYHYDWSLRMADAVVAVSEFTRRSCIEIVGISRRKVFSVYHSPDELPTEQRPEGWISEGWEKFVFYPANFWDHKNHAKLLQVLAQLRAQGNVVRCVFTGSLLGREQAWQTQVADAGVTDLVRHLGRRPRAELSWLYRHARGMVFPSLFEGFGIPVIEAMHSDIPVACSGTTALPEIAQDAALYFDPTDVSDIARCVRRIWEDDTLCVGLADRGRVRAGEFTAERLVLGHVEVFELARRRYHPWKHWYRQRVLEPRSRERRRELRPREIAAAQNLLRNAQVPDSVA
jgi:glycosyltransferase involved in cell wall biosynthesis